MKPLHRSSSASLRLMRSVHRRRGFTIMHMVAVVSLLGIFALVAAQLFSASTKAAGAAATATSRQLAGQSVLRLLREDAWSAGEIKLRGSQVVELRGGNGTVVVWTLESAGVVTRQVVHPEVARPEMEKPALRWELPPLEMTFEQAGPSLLLTTDLGPVPRRAVFASELLLLRGMEPPPAVPTEKAP